MTRRVLRLSVVINLEILGTQRNTLVERNMIADNTSLANHHARAVVDREILSYLRTRMDVDARCRMSLLGDDARNNGNPHEQQLMSQTIAQHGLHHGIAEHHLANIVDGRVVLEHRLHIGK